MKYEVSPISEFPIPIFNVETHCSCGTERFLLFDDYWHLGRYEYTRSGKGRFVETFSGKVLNPTNFAILPPCPTNYNKLNNTTSFDVTTVLVEKLRKLAKRKHFYCEDPWYSCPKAVDGCSNEGAGDICDCGADEHNAEVDSVYMKLIDVIDNKD